MIDLAMVFSERRRLRSVAERISKLPHSPTSSVFRAGFVVASCAAMAACSAQNGRTSVTAAAADPAVATAEASSGPTDDTKTAEAGTAPKALAALTKPVAIVGRGISIAGRKVATASVGLASWYGGKFHGRRTANGEQFDMEALTAAHPSMPLPSYARVTNVSNGRSVVVRVNDRGPFHGGRLIDVSRRTADVLGFRGAGVGNVKVDYVGPATAGDDRKLIATYQEFGRPAAPDGMQMAGLRPVSEAELMGQPLSAHAPATMLASVTTPAAVSTAMPVGLRGPTEATAYASQPTAPAGSALGQPLKVAGLRPATPHLAAVPSRIVTARTEPSKAETPRTHAPKVEVAKAEQPAPAKRVVQTADPVFASTTPTFGDVNPEPAVEQPKTKAIVSARIAASFEGFDSFKPAADNAGSGAFSGLR